MSFPFYCLIIIVSMVDSTTILDEAIVSPERFNWKLLSNQLGRELTNFAELREFGRELLTRRYDDTTIKIEPDDLKTEPTEGFGKIWRGAEEPRGPLVDASSCTSVTLVPTFDRPDVGVYFELLTITTDLRAVLVYTLPKAVQQGLGLVTLIGHHRQVDLRVDSIELLKEILSTLELGEVERTVFRYGDTYLTFRTRLLSCLSQPQTTPVFSPAENFLLVKVIGELDNYLEIIGKLATALR